MAGYCELWKLNSVYMVGYYRSLFAMSEISIIKNFKRRCGKQSRKCLGVELGSMLMVNLKIKDKTNESFSTSFPKISGGGRMLKSLRALEN